MIIAREILRGTLHYTDSLVRALSFCTTCGYCATRCSLETTGIIEMMRADAVREGVEPMLKHRMFANAIREKHNPYSEKHEERNRFLGETKLPDTAKIVYFVGCTSAYRQQRIARATFAVLGKLDADFTIMQGEWCCGSPLFRTGQVELAHELARHNCEAIEKVGAEKVITSCAGCYRTIKVDYPDIIGTLGFEVIHVSQFLDQMVKQGKLNLESEVRLNATYHDPCHIGRHLEVPLYEPPRNVISSIRGINHVEMARNKRNTWCCGAGGGFKSAHPDSSLLIAEMRVREAEKTGSDTLITSCPFCLTNLSQAVDKSGSTLKVYDLAEIVANCMENMAQPTNPSSKMEA